MGSCHVVQPETVRLPLSSGDTVEIKKELNAGEYIDQLKALAERKEFAKILASLVSWSFTVSPGGPPLPYALDLPEDVRRETIRAQDKRIIWELIATIDRH